MNQWLKIILLIVAIAAAMWLGYAKVVQPMYLKPRAEAIQRIARASSAVADFRRSLEDHARVMEELKQVVDRTLGGDFETVDHKLRTRLNRLAEQAQLRGITSSTRGGKAKESPAKARFSDRASRTLRDEKIDFHELEGLVSGSGTFEQVLQLVASLEAEPWIKRIDELRLDPRDNGERFNVTINLTTLFLPKRPPNSERALAARPVAMEKYALLIQSNPFRVPPPPVAAPALETVQKAAPPTLSIEQWSLTGIAQNPSGVEIWLLNRNTLESRTLSLGESLQEAVLTAAHGESAEFRIGEQHFRVAVGSSLRDRTPIDQ